MWGTRQPAFNCIIWLAREAAHAHSESGGRLAGHVGGRALRCDPRIVLPSRGLDGRLRVPSKTIDEARPHLVFWPRLSQPHLRSHCQLAESSLISFFGLGFLNLIFAATASLLNLHARSLSI